jgi:uncharacterized pyridoxamine 5'-phosphate oxidase family protein
MTRQEIIELIKNNPAFHLATMDGDQPRVRGMLLYKADETGIVFHSGTMKDVYKQIVNNPKVELCFNDFNKGIQVRVSGEMEIVNDNALKDEIYEHPSRGFLKPWRASLSQEDLYKSFVVFRLQGGKATIWTMETNLAPKEYIQL